MTNEGYYELFSKEEREYILRDESTDDYIFLLSADNIEELGLEKETLAAHTVMNGRRWGINIDGQDGNSWWWLRGDCADIYAPIVTSEGEIAFSEKEVNRPTGGLRPAIWVSKEEIE